MMQNLNNLSNCNVDILTMSSEDIDTICQLEQICFSQPWSRQSLMSSLENPESYFIVAKLNKNIAGYAGMYTVAGQGYIYNIAVFPEFRNIGIGKNLLKHLELYSIEKKLEFISLEVRESNKIARSMYENSGFKYMGTRKNFYKNPVENAIIMTKYLNNQ